MGVAKVLGADKKKGKHKVPLIQQYLEATDKGAFLLDIEGNGNYNKERTLKAAGWADNFWKVIQLF
jgi:hypothetical protein